ncbi:CII family transcriptional regulator [Ralstonia syzygii]|uniref:CII family transcriptional regulator n=1 Tax=Ralstonia syzygii TaxID=28097 RepID=UPI0018D1D445|nr:CII family transcriptional regulator [Ralstonia syzygii]
MSNPAETTGTVSPGDVENTRTVGARNEAELLRAVARVTQVRAAACMGVHASTISRRLEILKEDCALLAAFGLQLAPLDSMVIDPTELTAMRSMTIKYLQQQQWAAGRT